MRCVAPALFFALSSAALCQTAVLPPSISGPASPTPLFAPPPATDLDHLQLRRPGRFDISSLQRPRMEALSKCPRLAAPQSSPDAMIHRPPSADRFDARMIFRPEQSRIGDLPPGIPVAPNLYPDLRLQPIAQTNIACLEPLPVQWPNLSFHPAPITWPRMKTVPAQNSTELVAVPPAAKFTPLHKTP
jgi:hypothetical protein